MLFRLPSFLRTVRRASRGEEVLPRFLTYIVTFACNARCVMCDSWKMESKGDLSLDEIDAVFRQLPRMDAVRLTGGEPFARRDLAEIALLAERRLRPLVLHTTTNGFLTDRIVEFCKAKRRVPLRMLVSIDGVGAAHDAIRGCGRAYERALATVEELAANRRAWNLQVGINQTIVDPAGAGQYRALREVARRLAVPHNVVLAYRKSATYNLERGADVAPKDAAVYDTFGEFPQRDLAALLDEFDRDAAQLPFLDRLGKRYYLRGLRARLLEGRSDPNPHCVALNAHLRLYPNGDVPTCQFNGRVVGNLRTTSFADLWKSATAREQRAWVGKCPGCWAECEVLPSAAYTGDLVRSAIARTPAPAAGVAAEARP